LTNRETKTGVTIHYVDSGVDSGDIIKQVELAIDADDDEISLRTKSLSLCRTLLPAVIESIATGRVERTPQSREAASYYSFPPKGASRL
jgi:methionyl-tRNA formyltransferase